MDQDTLVEIRVIISDKTESLFIDGEEVLCECYLDLNVVLNVLAEHLPGFKVEWIEDYDTDLHLRR